MSPNSMKGKSRRKTIFPDDNNTNYHISSHSELSPTPSSTQRNNNTTINTSHNLEISDDDEIFSLAGSTHSSSSKTTCHKVLRKPKFKPYHCPLPSCKSTFARRFNMIQHFKSHSRRMGLPEMARDDIVVQLKAAPVAVTPDIDFQPFFNVIIIKK